MKKLFSAIVLATALFTNASAQKHEFYVLCDLPTASTYSTNSPVKFNLDMDFSSLGIGYNYIKPISETDPWNCIFGFNFQYGQLRNTIDVGGSAYLSDAEFTKMQIPLSLMYAIEVGTNVTIEPYAGLDASYYFSGNDVSTLVGKTIKEEWFPGSNRMTLGYHIGANLAIKKLVLGFEYQHDLTKFDSRELDGVKIEQKWFSYNFKLGYRF